MPGVANSISARACRRHAHSERKTLHNNWGKEAMRRNHDETGEPFVVPPESLFHSFTLYWVTGDSRARITRRYFKLEPLLGASPQHPRRVQALREEQRKKVLEWK